MAEIIDRWFQSRESAVLEGLKLRPRENPFLRGTALVTSRGQADVFFLYNGTKWILKKFLPNRKPELTYIRAIGSVLPSSHPGFESGTQRKILNNSSLSRPGYFSHQLVEWLDQTILMPCVTGLDWACWADKLRDGNIHLTKDQRWLLCKNLSEQIAVLENNGIAHRDLSSTNIMIDTQTWLVHLIDWDSLYHPKLQMPPNTTFGTSGYVSPIVKEKGIEDPRNTWHPLSDRFSLAVLNIEFLALTTNSSFTGDGGMFEQSELYNRSGPGISKIVAGIQQDFPDAIQLFDLALQAKRFEDCPSPGDWVRVSGLCPGFTAPSLSEIYDPERDLAEFMKKWKFEPPKPSPSLKDLEPISWESIPNSSSPPKPAPSLGDIPEPIWSN